jgi:hypothetical protein
MIITQLTVLKVWVVTKTLLQVQGELILMDYGEQHKGILLVMDEQVFMVKLFQQTLTE